MNVHDVANKLADIARYYHRWARAHPGEAPEAFPLYDKTCSLGKQLFNQGGKSAVNDAYAEALRHNPGQTHVIGKIWRSVYDDRSHLHIWTG